MLSWVPSIFKRFSDVKPSRQKRAPEEALLPAVLRIGNQSYPCTVVGEISEKTVVNLSKTVLIKPTDAIDIKLESDRTYRRFQMRWKHGLQLSLKPVTSWAAPNT